MKKRSGTNRQGQFQMITLHFSRLGLLNEMLIDELVIFFSLHEPFEASFYEMTFGRRP